MSTLCDEQKPLKGCFSSWPGGGREESIQLTVVIKVIFCFGHGIVTRYTYENTCLRVSPHSRSYYTMAQSLPLRPPIRSGSPSATSADPDGISSSCSCTTSGYHSRVESLPSIPFGGVRRLTAGPTSLLSILVIVGSNCIVLHCQL